MLDSNYQVIKRLFVFAYDNTTRDDQVSVNSYQKYFLQRVKIEKYNQPINDSIKQYNEIRKVLTRQGDDYTTDCLLDFAYSEKKKKKKKRNRLIAADLSKQKSLDVDQDIVKSTVANTRIIIYCILKQSKETTLQFSKVTKQVL